MTNLQIGDGIGYKSNLNHKGSCVRCTLTQLAFPLAVLSVSVLSHTVSMCLYLLFSFRPKKCLFMVKWQKHFRRGNWIFFFLHSVISLTECIGIVRVGKYRVVCLSVCVCVCLCVCLSVGARTLKLRGQFQ